jgi:hypothetical protein
MDNESWTRLRGLQRLLHDGVQQGTDFVEKHHRLTAAKPFRLLESVGPLRPPTMTVRVLHDGVLTVTYGSIRAINQVTRQVGGWLLETLGPPTDSDDP